MSEYLFSTNFVESMARLNQAQSDAAVWEAVTGYLAKLGIHSFSYGYLNADHPDPISSPTVLNSTTAPAWIDSYFEPGYEVPGSSANAPSCGRSAPVVSEPCQKTHVPKACCEKTHASTDAGRVCGLAIPLPVAPGENGDTAGIGLASNACGSSAICGSNFTTMLESRGTELIHFVHLMHARMAPKLLSMKEQVKGMSSRECDCLIYLAQGLRVARIAEKMSLSEATVNFHLRNARRKFQARTLPELVAKGFRYGVISL